MKKHVSIYLEAFNYHEGDFMPCEMCYSAMVDVHHIHRRGMGGSKTADSIENLMGLCRRCHTNYGDRKQYIEHLSGIHLSFLEKHGKQKRGI